MSRHQAGQDYMNENSPNPQNRPSVDALVTKLRELKTLRDPVVADYVIADIVAEYYYYKQKRPEALFRLMMRVNAWWRLCLGALPHDEEDKAVAMGNRFRHHPELWLYGADKQTPDEVPQEDESPPEVLHFHTVGGVTLWFVGTGGPPISGPSDD